jgi:hypothetical protein
MRICANCKHCSKMPTPVGLVNQLMETYFCSEKQCVVKPFDQEPCHEPFVSKTPEDKKR